MDVGIDIEVVDELAQRRLENLRFAMGETFVKYMESQDVVEVFLNSDGTLWAEEFGEMFQIGTMSPVDSLVFLRQVASALGENVNYQNAIIEGEFPLDGSRFAGVAPPIVEQVAFNIRKKPSRIYPCTEYVQKGVLPFHIYEILRASILARKNILVVGGTGSGKTTFCNAILNEMNMLCPDARVLIMEDTRELQCSMKNKVMMRSYEHASMQQLLKAMMRMRPDRIVVGEVRGMEALSLLKAWNTGHPGGLCTVHADSAYKGLSRLDQLISEVSVNHQRILIGEAVQLAVFLERTPNGRRITEVVEVYGYDEMTNKYEHKIVYMHPWREKQLHEQRF